MDPNQITDAVSLMEALERRGDDPDTQRDFDDAVWEAIGSDGAVLVTDLSGFTRTTRARGILHFLAIFRRCQMICTPLINKHGGSLMKTEADDLIGVFESAREAVECGLDMLRCIRDLNRTQPEDQQLGLCIGVESGRFLRLSDDAFGDPVNTAFKLGEDIAEPGELLIGGQAHQALGPDIGDDDAHTVRGPLLREIGGAELAYYSIRLRDEEV